MSNPTSVTEQKMFRALITARGLYSSDYNRNSVYGSMVHNSLRCDCKKKRLKRSEVDEYIIAEDVAKLVVHQDNCCWYCDVVLNHEGNRNSSKETPNAITIERLDNDISHTRDNCALACARCNNIRKQKMSSETMMKWWPKLHALTHSYCCKCNLVLPVDRFHKSKANPSGVQGYCKPHHILDNYERNHKEMPLFMLP